MQLRVVSGTAIGGSHLNVAKNGQDARSVRRTSDGSLVAVVADGCSAQPESGVGAALMAPICATYIAQALRRGQDLTDIRVRRNIRKRISGKINDLANEMAGDEPAAPYINKYFLFTLNLVVVTKELTYFLHLGDGLYGYNDKMVVLKPTAGNKPIYIAYDVTGSPMTDADPTLLDFVVGTVVPTSEITTFWAGTDGLKEVLDAHAKGRKVSGMFIEDATAMIRNPEYHDSKEPGALDVRLAAVVDSGYSSDDVTIIGGEIVREPVDTPTAAPDDAVVNTDTEDGDDPAGKAQADDVSAGSTADDNPEPDTNGAS